jgi:hypothetical protein
MDIILLLAAAICVGVGVVGVVWYIGWGPPVFRRDIEDWPDVGT